MHLRHALQEALNGAGAGRQQQQAIPHTATVAILLLNPCTEAD